MVKMKGQSWYVSHWTSSSLHKCDVVSMYGERETSNISISGECLFLLL